MFYLVYPFFWLLSLLPLNFLYWLAKPFYFFIYYVVRYRRKVVRTNLLHSFPDKSLHELIKLEKDFYHFFSELLMEIVKLIHMSDEELSKRVTFVDSEQFFELCSQGRYPLLMLGHYGNWEWILSISLLMPKNTFAFTVYKRLKNKKFNQFMLNLRTKRGAVMVKNEVYCET